MSTKSRPALTLIALLLCSCMLQPQNGEAPAHHRLAAHLRESNGILRLDHAFQDFYDTAFVLTNAGRATPRVVSLAELADTLVGYDVVVYGESHGHAGIHLQQMQLLRALYQRDSHWMLSLEQFERDVQGVLDDYLAGRIGENTLIDKGRAWNNYAASYRPLVIFAKEHHLPIIAAEAPGWTVTCVGQWGTPILDEFTPLERSWVAQNLHVVPGAYHDKYAAFLGGSPAHAVGVTAPGGAAPHDAVGAPHADGTAPAAKAERSFSAQVTRDDTMAESIDRALQIHPGFKLLHLTGNFHSAGFLGTVERLRMRNPTLKVAVIEPVEVDDASAPSFSAERLGEGTVLQLIYPNPEAFVDGEDTSAMMAKMTRAHETNRCKYEPPASPEPPAAPPPATPR